MKRILFLFYILSILSCTEQEKPSNNAREIIAKCIQKHGGNSYKKMDVSFDFRQYKIHLMQHDGVFLYERSFTDSLGNFIIDRLTNDSFARLVNDRTISLSPKDEASYKESLNAVAYFALLPYKLSEPAVNLSYLGTVVIDKNTYDKIGVSFKKEGGGTDYKDEFCYWINQTTNTLDYLAYSSGGPRFRKATKRTKVDGITFQDYDNYALSDTTIKTSAYDQAYKDGKVKLLSKIQQVKFQSNKPRN